MDEGWLDLDRGDDPLSIAEHCIAQRRKRRGHVQEWFPDHPSWITSGVYSRPQAVGECHDVSRESELQVGRRGKRKELGCGPSARWYLCDSAMVVHLVRLTWPRLKLGCSTTLNVTGPRNDHGKRCGIHDGHTWLIKWIELVGLLPWKPACFPFRPLIDLIASTSSGICGSGCLVFRASRPIQINATPCSRKISSHPTSSPTCLAAFSTRSVSTIAYLPWTVLISTLSFTVRAHHRGRLVSSMFQTSLIIDTSRRSPIAVSGSNRRSSSQRRAQTSC